MGTGGRSNRIPLQPQKPMFHRVFRTLRFVVGLGGRWRHSLRFLASRSSGRGNWSDRSKGEGLNRGRPKEERVRDGLTDARITEIGRRANALRVAGFYTREEVRWLAGYVRQPSAALVEVEFLLTNAEEIVKWGSWKR